jgi:GDPmannose 4,6-dehydratase
VWLMLQQKKPKDYVIGTGEAHSVKEFAKEAFAYLGLDWKKYVKVDKKFFRPADVYNLRADARLAKRELGWEPKIKFKELVRIMVGADLEHFKNGIK